MQKVSKYALNVKGAIYSMQASNIINGRAYTDKDTKLFTDLPKDIQYALTKWIYHNIASRKTVNHKYTSSDWKGLAEAAIGF